MEEVDGANPAFDLLCALFAGAACGPGGPPADGVAACATSQPYAHVYRLQPNEAADGAMLEQALSVLEQRLRGAGACALVAEASPDGTVTIRAVSAIPEGPLSPASLQPGIVAFYPVLASETPMGPGVAVLPDRSGAPITVRLESMVPADPISTAETIVSADLRQVVRIHLTDAASDAFAEATAEMVGRQVAITVDDRVMLTPRIMQPFRARSLELGGDFSPEEADQLAAVLDSGSLGLTFVLRSIEQVPVEAAADR